MKLVGLKVRSLKRNANSANISWIESSSIEVWQFNSPNWAQLWLSFVGTYVQVCTWADGPESTLA
jgi:hypothetical protein